MQYARNKIIFWFLIKTGKSGSRLAVISHNSAEPCHRLKQLASSQISRSFQEASILDCYNIIHPKINLPPMYML